MTRHLSLVPMPEYSEPDAAPDEFDPLQALLLLVQNLHEVEVLAPDVQRCQSQDRRAMQRQIAAAIAALQGLQTAQLSNA